MLRSRSFWTGIGCGFVIGAILLQLMLWGATPPESEAVLPSDLHPLTPEELERRADQLGYVLLPNDVTWLDSAQVESDWEQREQQIREEALEEALLDAPTIRSFIIVPGMTSDDVADMLLQLGLIRDKELFKSLLTQENLHRTLQARLYVFHNEPTIEEIIDKITTN